MHEPNEVYATLHYYSVLYGELGVGFHKRPRLAPPNLHDPARARWIIIRQGVDAASLGSEGL